MQTALGGRPHVKHGRLQPPAARTGKLSGRSEGGGQRCSAIDQRYVSDGSPMHFRPETTVNQDFR
eukprot:9013005-Pyramimonas_sp.AAC.1